jgi:hypothetical protein
MLSSGHCSGWEGHVFGLMTRPFGVKGSPCHYHLLKSSSADFGWESGNSNSVYICSPLFTVMVGALLHDVLLSFIETAGHSGLG